MKAINIPAIRGVIGTQVYYTSSFTFKQIAEYVKPVDEELHTSQSLREQLQRSLTTNYKSIKGYILTQNERFFNALVLAVYDGEPVWNELEIDFKGEVYYNMGFLKLNGEEKIFPVDGQHRVESIKDAIKENPELEDETITVILIGHKKDEEGMKKTRRIFSTLNRYAKPVSTGDIIALDEDDTVAIVTRELLESYPLFMGNRIKIDKKNSKGLADNDFESFTSLITLYETNRIIYRYYVTFRDKSKKVYSDKGVEPKLKFRPEQKEIDSFEKYVRTFWDTFSLDFEGMKDYLASDSSKSALKYRNKENGGLLYFRPIALPQLVAAILEICYREKMSLNDTIKRVSKMEMCISSSLWSGILWSDKEKTMIMKYKRLVYLLILYLSNNNNLKKSEIKTLASNYAKAYDITEEEALAKLKELV